MAHQESPVDGLRLLVMAPNSWYGQWVNRQQLFSRLGQEHQVLYSTGGWFTWDRSTPEWKQASWTGGFTRADNVWVDEPALRLTRVPKLRLLDELAMSLQARRWRRFLGERGSGAFVAYVFHPMFFPYIKFAGADYVIYHAYDLYSDTPGWNSELEQSELELARTSDLVIAASDQIAEALRGRVAREIRVLPNGADVKAFSDALIASVPPDDLNNIPHPRLGWVGSLHPQVDYSLIAELAMRRPLWNFVLVGQVISHTDARADAERATCRWLPNVYFLGSKRVDEVSKYVANMDVNLMFYRLSEGSWIKAGYPLKLHEYLAVGRPVVSADLPSVRPFSEVVRIARGVDDWLAAIEEALQSGGRGTPAQRKAVARDNSWDNRVQTLNSWLIELTAGGKTVS